MPRSKPSSGQMNLMGEFFNLGVKYPPQVSKSAQGLAVVVLRLPQDVSEIDRAMSYKAMKELAKITKSNPVFWKRKIE